MRNLGAAGIGAGLMAAPLVALLRTVVAERCPRTGRRAVNGG